jgi:hypothetical protein
MTEYEASVIKTLEALEKMRRKVVDKADVDDIVALCEAIAITRRYFAYRFGKEAPRNERDR